MRGSIPGLVTAGFVVYRCRDDPRRCVRLDESLDTLLIEDLTDDEDDAFAAALRS